MRTVPLGPARVLRVLAVMLAVLATAALAAGCGRSGGAAASPAVATSPAAAGTSTAAVPDGEPPDAAALAPATATTDLPTMTVAQLPDEGVDTLRLIAADGPFPYSKDGSTFQNRERRLPTQRSGFYEEYTVLTPGSDDRGARRIVTGADGARFYTDDHYGSFREVVSGAGS
jgi:ribonuclease T1